jgi:glycosyltransferase involved in cell wall biosynthesis
LNSETLTRLADLKVAIVHHWFVKPWCGAERVVEAIANIFPQADLFAMISDPEVLPTDLRRRKITTSFLQHIPGRYRWHRQLMPLYPLALEQLDLSEYDLVISSESAPAKGVITSAGTCHICYCHTPMRYVWDMYHGYRSNMGPVSRILFSTATHYLRLWDVCTASRVDYFIANSRNVAERIRKHYRRDAVVISPPIDISEGFISEDIRDYYLVLGRLVDYKRVEIAIEACNRINRRLMIVGDGPQMKSLRKLAGPMVQFLGQAPREEVREAYAHCRALLSPGEEDFGLVPLEAQSYGRPVIAYAKGGALETVRGIYSSGEFDEEATGIFFSEQSATSLSDAIEFYESVERRFSPRAIRARAILFGEDNFRREMAEFIVCKMENFRTRNRELTVPVLD